MAEVIESIRARRLVNAAPTFLLAMAALLLAGCDTAESARVDEARARLMGTWLREVEAGSTKSRRLLVLGRDGKFTDRIVTTAAGEPARRRDLAGEWSYDGTNLKRRYLSENGRQFSGGSMRYATFPLVSVTASEFVVQDTIEGRDTGFRRVPDDTQP